MVKDVIGLRALPLGLRKLVMGGNQLTAPSMMDEGLVAVAVHKPDLVNLCFSFGALHFRPDLLSKMGAACRGPERLHLLLRCDADALRCWQAEQATAAILLLFPWFTKVAVDVLKDLRVWTHA